MNTTVIVLALANLAVIGALPRIFFRRGRLNLGWWVTAAPFVLAAATLLAGFAGILEPSLASSAIRDSAAVLLSASSLGLIGYTLGTHKEPLSLWHQPSDTPARLVTHGAYSRVRHPFYTSFLIALLGAVAALPHLATFGALIFAAVQLNRTAAREERRLLASAFGEAYAAYKTSTGRFFPI